MEDAIPLQFVTSGSSATILHVDGRPTEVQRLAELGVACGKPLEVIQGGSPCIVQLDGARLCLRYDKNECHVLVRVGQ
jgi:Fe2+ transport system protein FeoA